jgi:long-chain acyl-CoA synthetase
MIIVTIADKPWLALYGAAVPHEFTPALQTGLEVFARGVEERPGTPAILYFDRSLSFAEADREAHALAAAFQSDLGVRAGDRIALMLQNVPQFPIAVHAAWLCGAVITPVNPMNKPRELEYQLADAGVRAIVCLESLHEAVDQVRATTPLEHVVTVSELDYLDEIPELLSTHERLDCPGALRWADLVRAHAGERVDPAEIDPSSPALITYTSGTTAMPKGALNPHSAVAYNSQAWQYCFDLERSDVTVAMAPLFHITGLIAHMTAARFMSSPLLLAYRFDAGTLLELIERWRGTYMIGPLTAYIALMAHPDFGSRDISSLTKVGSGGAPVSPAIADRFERATGVYLYNCYGLTEATTIVTFVPPGTRAPVDPDSGALSVGVPVPGTDAKIVSTEDGSELAPGEAGELLVRGPMIVPGYWNKPEESAGAIVDGWLHTGDVAKRDQDGWFFVIDRVKDMINASGYKVWPRDVEDVLYQHPGVREACVVGVPDEYRGETVRAYVVLEQDGAATPDELIAHCRKLMAVYKAPREVEIVGELPKTTSGKLLRRELRQVARSEAV